MCAARTPFQALFLLLLCAAAAAAHIGSPDVYFQGSAGPYRLLVAIRAPDVVPGVARVEVRALNTGVERVELTPTPMTGEAAKHPPTADLATRSDKDPQYFEGALWLMTGGAWKVRIHAAGAEGQGELQVPINSVAQKTLPMQRGVSYFLFGMMIFLTAGLVAIVGAGMRESRLEPGVEAKRWSAMSVTGMAVAAMLSIWLLWWANGWWGEEAAAAGKRIYKPLEAQATLAPPDTLQLHLVDPGWITQRAFDNLIPDHGHLMHLFLVRWPSMDRMYHLHPGEAATAFFETALPSMDPGNYRIFADIVHENGFAETAVGDVALPEVSGKPLSGDDSGGVSAPVNSVSFPLADGYRMIWTHDAAKPIVEKQVTLFTFSIADPAGKPVSDLEPYMGMGGHAEFLKADGSVFAHVHPSGTVSMASEEVASPEGMMAMHQMNVGTSVSFPYGLPSAGEYRIFVQMKRAGKVQSGAFRLTAEPAASGR